MVQSQLEKHDNLLKIDKISLFLFILFLNFILGITMKKSSTKLLRVKTRITWAFNPVTRVVKSKKIYNRKKLKIEY